MSLLISMHRLWRAFALKHVKSCPMYVYNRVIHNLSSPHVFTSSRARMPVIELESSMEMVHFLIEYIIGFYSNMNFNFNLTLMRTNKLGFFCND